MRTSAPPLLPCPRLTPRAGLQNAGLAAVLLALTAAASACAKLNPAFDDVPGAFDSATTIGESDATDGGGSDSEGTTAPATSTDTASGSATESGGELTTASTTAPDSTSTASDSATTTGLETTGCDAPCDGSGSCVDGDEPVAINCVDGCEVETACGQAATCEVIVELAKCVGEDACAVIDAAYQALVEDPASTSCVDDNDCQTISGACEIPSAECWEVLNTDVAQEELDDLGQQWMEANCGGECNCEGEGPTAVCDNGVCAPE